MPNKLFFVILLFISSCSSINDKKYVYPVSNPYPKLFDTLKSSTGDLLMTKIDFSTLNFSCSKRTDGQPYYWCLFQGEFFKKVDQLPSKLSALFHVQLPSWGVRNVKSFIKKSTSKSLTVFLLWNPYLDKEDGSVVSKMFAFHDSKSCIAFLGHEDELCPKDKEIVNIYQK